jgi:hypothetical protein
MANDSPRKVLNADTQSQLTPYQDLAIVSARLIQRHLAVRSSWSDARP